ncbi:hypothetical protein SUGI_0947190 [Cryptomeria japonica]|nr:hypothetical protein SUGI_0947190 [Cryptomeria japonica]
MDFDYAIPPKFTAGHVNAAFLTSSGVLHQAWKEICSISTNNIDTSIVNEYESVVYVTFRSLYGEDFNVSDGRYGECNIQNDNGVFSANLKVDDGKPALVFKGALNRFLHTMQSSNLEAQMQRFANQKKEQAIIFVGHSMGGAVATLATIWFLEKRLRNISPFCITFGSPLVGDASLGEAIGREDWSGKFCHVVSQYDIVPRMLLAPFESISEPLNTIMPH